MQSAEPRRNAKFGMDSIGLLGPHAQGFTPVSGRERRTEDLWKFGGYLLNLSDASQASLVKLALWAEPRTITVMVPEMPYS
jgi:hypothetical protein